MKLLSAILIVFLLFGCDRIPSDPEKSYEKARAQGLLVGYTDNPPWVIDDAGIISGIEPDILNSFAESNGIELKWIKGSEQELLLRLEKGELQIVAAGLLMNTPWKSEKIGLTSPYYKNRKEKRVLAVQQGENRLIMKLEKYFFSEKDEIKQKADAVKP